MNNAGSLYVKSSRYEIRIAGSGGQGIISAGIMLAEAAILDGKYVAQSQIYGPETRGGNSIAELILSDTEIDYPQALELDLLVALTQEACDRNLPDMKADGLVIVDSDAVRRVLWEKLIPIPFQQIAQKASEERAVNVAALGAIVPFCPVISRQSLVKAITKRMPSTKLTASLLAFDEALKVAQRFKSRLESAPERAKEEFEI